LALVATLGPPARRAGAATIGGTFYAPQYDFAEFFAATDHRNFQVVVAGARRRSDCRGARPAAGDAGASHGQRSLSTTTRRSKGRVPITDCAGFQSRLNSSAVCNGAIRLKQDRPGMLNLYAVYCRNDQVMSETTAWTPAIGPNDPRVEGPFRQLFQVVFSDSPALKPAAHAAQLKIAERLAWKRTLQPNDRPRSTRRPGCGGPSSISSARTGRLISTIADVTRWRRRTRREAAVWTRNC
jgi:hypothetical protein